MRDKRDQRLKGRIELFRFDARIERDSPGWMAGIDEAGRGPLAGPVVAAAVVFLRKTPIPGLNDSKKLTAAFRKKLFSKILAQAVVGVARVGESVIDRVNILEATRLAMRQAVLALPKTPQLLLIDGRIRLDLPLPQKAIVRGDGQSASIAAASIVAKVYRDHWMEEMDRRYPGYGFRQHKGYPTPQHLERLQSRGASPIHRRTFRPVTEVLENSLNLTKEGAVP